MLENGMKWELVKFIAKDFLIIRKTLTWKRVFGELNSSEISFIP